MSETNVTIINMQPTTDYVNIGGPLINPSEYATKNEINEKLDNYATVKQATDIARNITDSALENGYYTSSEIDGKLDCKSNTDHTHTNIYNELTINSNSFKLLSSKSEYTTFTMGKKDKNYESAVIGYGDDYMGKYLYMRINGGKQLTLYGDRATLEADLTVTSLNGITPSTISLNTHNHDDKYALVDHTHTTNDVTDIDILAKADHNHDETYSKLDHTHGNMYSPYKHTHIKFDNDLRINGELNDFTIPEAIEDPGEFNPPMLVGVRNNGSTRIGNELIFYRYIIDTDIYKKGFKLFVDENHNLIFNNITETTESKLFEFSMVDSRHPLYTVRGGTENSTGFSIKNSSTNNWWRFAAAYNANDKEEYLRLYWNNIYLCYFKNCDDDINLLNTTITHNAPLEESLDNYVIGKPVFISGNVYKLKEGKYVDRTDTTDCIPSVKTEGKYKEYLGIVVAKHKAGETVTVGDVVKHDVIIGQDTIDFATHGDFYLKVNDSWPYQVGDTVLYNGDIVNDEGPMTNKIQRMIAGVVTAIVDPGTLAIFKA